MKAKSKLSLEKYLKVTERSYRELIEFESFKFIDSQDENGVDHYIIVYYGIGDKMHFYEFDMKEFYELLTLYLGGLKELHLMQRLFEELINLTEEYYIVKLPKRDDING